MQVRSSSVKVQNLVSAFAGVPALASIAKEWIRRILGLSSAGAQWRCHCVAATDVAVFPCQKRTEVGIFIVSIATFEGLMVIQSVQPMTIFADLKLIPLFVY